MPHCYAIEYAYGADMVNDGQRADTVRVFGSREQRSAWISKGAQNPNEAGYRVRVPASRKRVKELRAALAEYGWREQAEARVDETPRLQSFVDLLFYDWKEDGHLEWVTTAPVAEIVDWAETIRLGEQQ